MRSSINLGAIADITRLIPGDGVMDAKRFGVTTCHSRSEASNAGQCTILIMRSANMKSKFLRTSLGAAAVLAAGVALAAGTEVVTRSTADMEADLMRTYTSPGGQPAGQIKTRSADEAYADLVRDWDGKQTKAQGSIVGVESSAPVVNTRSSEDANKDLMRIWN